MSPFLPALFLLSHPWSALDLAAGNCDRAGQAPSSRVSDHAATSSHSAGGCKEAQPSVGSTSSSPGHVHVHSAAVGGKGAAAAWKQRQALSTNTAEKPSWVGTSRKPGAGFTSLRASLAFPAYTEQEGKLL